MMQHQSLRPVEKYRKKNLESLRWRNSKLMQIVKGGQQHAEKPHGGIGGQGRICKTKWTKRKGYNGQRG